MMKKMVLTVAAALLAAGFWTPASACEGPDCPHAKAQAAAAAHQHDAGCPCMIEGAQKQVTNTADGVTITITAKDPAVVKKIQDSAAKMGKGCACGGKCEKCAGHKKAGAQKKDAAKEEKKADKPVQKP